MKKPQWWEELAKDSPILLPSPQKGIPTPPSHILHHPRDQTPGYEDTSARKTAAWILVHNAIKHLEPPDACLALFENGQVSFRIVVYLEKMINFRDGSAIRGVALMAAQIPTGVDTTLYGIFRGDDGIIKTAWVSKQGRETNIFQYFTLVDCPPVALLREQLSQR